eukprot:6214599-Pleurochrysis_carterae.AAC.1
MATCVLIPSGYIGEFEVVDDHRSGKIVVELIGRINKCGVISPRFDVCHSDIEQWVVNLLPARQFGHIILTTSLGIMDHEEAKRKQTGGKVLAILGFESNARLSSLALVMYGMRWGVSGCGERCRLNFYHALL